MERLAIFAALQWECRPIVRHLRRVARTSLAGFTVWRSVAPGREVWLIKTGVGEQRAATAAGAVDKTGGFNLFLSTGCAGGLVPSLSPGDLTVANKVIGNSPGECFETDVAFRERAARAAQRAALRTVIGPFLCSPCALTTAAAKHAAATQSGAIAVAMEGAGIAAAAARAAASFASIRAILDTSATELDEAGEIIDLQSGTVDMLRLVQRVATRPGAIAQLLALLPMMRAAQGTLDKFFAAFLRADA